MTPVRMIREHLCRLAARLQRAAPRAIPALCAALWIGGGKPPAAVAQDQRLMDAIGFEQNLDGAVPLDLEFRNQDGEPVRLGDHFDGRPVILTPVYYKCPMLCGLELNGLVRSLRSLETSAGEEFLILTYSIDPRETPPLAKQKRKQYLARYGRPGAERGWHFLTGEQPEIDRLNAAIGFQAVYDERSGEYAHAAGIVVCTPEGRISRYFYGVEFAPRDLRLGLLESSRNRIGSLADQIMLYCYMYDPTQGKYGLAILNLIRAGGIVTVLAIGGGVCWMLRQERLAAAQGREEGSDG